MKNLAFLALVPVALAGCQSVEQLQRTVGNASNFQLCRAIIIARPEVANIARQEASSRNLDCGPYTAGVLQNEAQNDAAIDALSQQLLRNSQPRPQVNCTSYRNPSGIVNTVCR